MSQSIKIHFYPKMPKDDAQKCWSIYLRLTMGGERVELSTKRMCDPRKWNRQAQRVSGTKEDVKQLNHYLDTLQARVYEAQRALAFQGEAVTATTLRNKLIGKEEKQATILSVYAQHNQQFAVLVESGKFAKGTLKKFRSAYNSLQAFIHWKFQQMDYPVRKINVEFVSDYEFFLKTLQGNEHNSAMAHIKKLKKIVRKCVANEWLDKDPFGSYKITTKETHRAYLLQEELERILHKELPVQRLEQVRDIFLFSCYTGLCYSDIMELKRSDLVIGMDGSEWIFTTRIKTDTASRIPLLPVAHNIIEKYRDHPKVATSGRLLPRLSNQRLNAYLKELTAICGVTKELTFHCARHTFATTVTLSNGVPIESISKMLGHKNLRTTQLYAKILDQKVSEDMQALKQRLGNAQ